MVVAVVVAALSSKPLPSSVSTPSSSLVSLRQSVASLIPRTRWRSLDEVNHAAIKLVLGELLLVTENPPAEDQSLSVGRDSHSAADPFLEIFHSLLLVNLLNLVILRVKGLDGDCPHICQCVSALYLKC